MEKKKLSVSKETLKNLAVKTGVTAGDVVFAPDPSRTCSCTSCTCRSCGGGIFTTTWVINPPTVSVLPSGH